jgi:hypothetical protein
MEVVTSMKWNQALNLLKTQLTKTTPPTRAVDRTLRCIDD